MAICRLPCTTSWLRSLVAGCVILAACATTDPILQQARDHFTAGRGEEALAVLDKATKEHPDVLAYRTEYVRQRELLGAQWLGVAENARAYGQLDVAEEFYRRILKADPQNERARAGLSLIATARRHRASIAEAEKLVKAGRYGEAGDELRPVLAENPNQRDALRLQRTIDEKTTKPAWVEPQLRFAVKKALSLELREVTLRSMFDVIGRTGGINFVFDKDVRADQRTSLVVREATIEDIIRTVLAANQLAQKPVNETTVIVFPNTEAKLREYRELVVKSFYLTNADAKQTANMLRAIMKTRDVYIDEKINMVVIRDTPGAIRNAERLIAAHDLAEPEVMLEVEVLEVSNSLMLDLGLKFPDSIAWSLVGSLGLPGVLTLPEWLNRGSELVRLTFTDPLFLLRLRQQDSQTSVLANPRIRVSNRNKAKIHIGDRVPVITTTAAAVGGFVSESVSYLDVGLKFEVEPLIHPDDEIAIKLALEVSNIAQVVQRAGPGGTTLAYQIGTRNATTLLRLKDGETQVLAGLISDEDRRTANRVPGIGNLPIVGRLFSQTSDSATKTQIVLLITPRLIRTLERPAATMTEFRVGTEASLGAAPLSAGPALAPPVTPLAPPVAPPPPPKPEATPGPPTMVPFGGVQPYSDQKP